MSVVNDLIERTLVEKIEELDKLEFGSEEHSKAVDDICKLYRVRIDKEKNDKESVKFREQMDEQRKDRYFRLAGIVIPIGLSLSGYALLMRQGLKFEETGTISSSWVRNLIHSFKPVKIG